MTTSSDIVKSEYQGAVEVREQVNAIQHLMAAVLKEGTHYGKIPGTGKDAKPSLLQPGAEKIAQMFHLVPKYSYQMRELPGGHREYDFVCTLVGYSDGAVAGEGYGLCSTMESKYRYRNEWRNGQKYRQENPDIADTYNTVFKMAKKRAFVDAVKSTTAASDIFTQDVEDMPAYMFQGGQQPAQAQAQPSGPQLSSQTIDARRAVMQSLSEQLADATRSDVESCKKALFHQGDYRTMDQAQWDEYRGRCESTIRSARMAVEDAVAEPDAINDDAGIVEPDEVETGNGD